MLLGILIKLKNSKYKYAIYLTNGKRMKIKFGAAGYEDYTIHRNIERKKNYIDRHKMNEDWSNPHTKGFWSRWVLWNKPTIEESLMDIQKKFNIEVLQFTK
jgi:sRNA-binding regulator protein Hfq